MSSPLLIDEPPLQVLPSLAVAVGLNEALILQQVHYWIQAKRKAPERYPDSLRHGEWWVYNSVPEWNAQFPFWGDNTIRRALASLREAGLLVAGQLAADPRDKTLWYRIDYDKLENTTALHHAPKGTAGKKFAGNMAEIKNNMAETETNITETEWVDAPTQNGQMAAKEPSPSAQNGRVHQTKMGKSHLPILGSSHPPKMGKTLTETSSENSQRLPQKTKSSAARFTDLVEDQLESLPAAEYAALEAAARARVIAESSEPIRSLAQWGKAKVVVNRMMLTILRETQK